MLTILEYIMDTLKFSTNASRFSKFKIVQKKIIIKIPLLKLSKLKESKREDWRLRK